MGGGIPGMGGGMPGMPPGLAQSLFSDPEFAASLQNPKVMAALSNPAELMTNPAKFQELMSDPEVGPVFQKLMSKIGGGMPSGMPGMGGMGGMPGGFGDDDDDDIPDIDELPDLE